MIISLDKYKKTGGIVVEGDIGIYENGIHDVAAFATATVAIPGEKPEAELNVGLEANGYYEYFPNEGAVFNSVYIHVNVPVEENPAPSDTELVNLGGVYFAVGHEPFEFGRRYEIQYLSSIGNRYSIGMDAGDIETNSSIGDGKLSFWVTSDNIRIIVMNLDTDQEYDYYLNISVPDKYKVTLNMPEGPWYVGELYTFSYETDLEINTYWLSRGSTDYENKTISYIPNIFDNEFNEIWVDVLVERENYIHGRLVVGRLPEIKVPEKYTATIQLPEEPMVLGNTYTLSYETALEPDEYRIEIDNCDCVTDCENKTVTVTPRPDGCYVDTNTVYLWINSFEAGLPIGELPQFVLPEDFPGEMNFGDVYAVYKPEDDTVVFNYFVYAPEDKPLARLVLCNYNGEEITELPITTYNTGEVNEAVVAATSVRIADVLIRVMADYNGNSYVLNENWVYIDGWEDKPKNYISDVDTAIWGNPDEAIPVTMAEFVAAEPISINTETGEVSNAQWYEITGKILSAGVENGKFNLQSIDGDCGQNINSFENAIFICSSNNNISMMDPIGDGWDWFPGDGADIKIRTLKHNYDYYNHQDHELTESDHGKTIGGSYKGSPCAVYIATIEDASEPEPL